MIWKIVKFILLLIVIAIPVALALLNYIDIGLAGILAALILGSFGIFQDTIRKLFFGPKLKIGISVEPPDCHKIELKNPNTGARVDDTYYFRFRVENNGNYEAKNVQVMMTRLEIEENGKYELVKNFLPLNLTWAHYGGITMQVVPSGVFKHCDLGHILRGALKDAKLNQFGLIETLNIIFQTDVSPEPNTGSHIIFPGKYRLYIHLSSTNCKSIKEAFGLDIRDVWCDDEEKMLREGISIKKLKR